MATHRLQTSFLLGLLVAIIVLAFLIFWPYLGAVVVAATFAVIFHPLYRRLVGLRGGRESIAAALATVCVLIVVILPLAWFGWQLFQETRAVYLQVSDPTTSFSSALFSLSQQRLGTFLPSVDFDQYTEQALQWLLEHTGQLFASIAKLSINIFLSLIALFYLLRDGERLRARLIALSPLWDTHDRLISKRLHDAINSVIKGSLLVALIQGIATGTGLALFEVPNPVLWGSIAIIAALIPSLGTAIVLTPAILYLYLTNQWWQSAGLLIWGATAVGLIDNLLGPALIGRSIKIHPLLILLAVLGGLSFFGPLGFILGPLVVSLLFAVLDIYERMYVTSPRRPAD